MLPSVLALFLLASAAQATPFTLTLDPDQSTLTVRDDFTGNPVLGPVSLSGTITFDVSGLPGGSFTVTQLDATGAGGIVLANGSGSGIHGGGALLFQTPLFVDVTVPGYVSPSTELGFPAPIGALLPNGDDSAIAAVAFSAEVQLTETESLVLEVFAVPEPAGLLALGIAWAALRAASERVRPGRLRASSPRPRCPRTR